MKDSTPTQVSKRGRPSQGKSGAFKFRVTASLRQKLEAEAEAVERPVSEQIERRLDDSYRLDIPIEKIFGNRRNFARIAAILEAMESVENIKNSVIETDGDRECLKTLAAIKALNSYARVFCPDELRREKILLPVLSIDPNKDLVEDALIRVDPFYASWNGEPEIGTLEDTGKRSVEIRQEATTVAKEQTSRKKPRR